MLLVDDDEAEVMHGSEKRAAGADDHMRLAVAHEVPLVESLAGRKTRMQHSDIVGETRPEPAHRLGREGDFGNEDDGGLPGAQHIGDGTQVDLGLARSRDPIDHDDVGRGVARKRRPYRREGISLTRRQGGDVRARVRACRHRIAQAAAMLDAHDPTFLE